MKLIRFRHGPTLRWGLLDDSGYEVRHVLGALPAWAPLIANGAGEGVLPCSGERSPLGAVEVVAPVEPSAKVYSEIDGLDHAGFSVSDAPREVAIAAGDRVAVVVIGAPLAGRSNPLRSVLGYGVASRTWRGEAGPGRTLIFAPSILGRARFGDASPDLSQMWEDSFGPWPFPFPDLIGLAGHLSSLNARTPLQPGDMVLAPI